MKVGWLLENQVSPSIPELFYGCIVDCLLDLIDQTYNTSLHV